VRCLPFLSASGSFTVPAGVSRVQGHLWAGGGSGASPTYAPDGGGSSGGYVQASIPVLPGQVLTGTLGAGGSGVVGGGGEGNPGGDNVLNGPGWQLIAGGGGGTYNATAGGAQDTSGVATLPADSDRVVAQGTHWAFGDTASTFGGDGASARLAALGRALG